MITEIDHGIAEIQDTGLQPPDDSMSEITSTVNTSPFSWEVNIGVCHESWRSCDWMSKGDTCYTEMRVSCS